MVVDLQPPARGHAWVIGRGSIDFTDNELDLARPLAALLNATDRLYAGAPPTQLPIVAEEPTARLGLTAREVDVLTLVAQGHTAEAIGRLRRISIRTVRKHLQNLYAKLGVSDRLMAVERARHLGILARPDDAPLAAFNPQSNLKRWPPSNGRYDGCDGSIQSRALPWTEGALPCSSAKILIRWWPSTRRECHDHLHRSLIGIRSWES